MRDHDTTHAHHDHVDDQNRDRDQNRDQNRDRDRGQDRRGGRDDHDLGLRFDLRTLLGRRRVLGLLAGGGLLAAAGIAGCGGSEQTGTAAATAGTRGAPPAGGTAGGVGGSSADATAQAAGDTDAAIPEETSGPYPADGSNGPNVLDDSGIVRADIRSSFAAASAVATGVGLGIVLRVLDTSRGGAPYAGAAVYLWHCDSQGRYSLYSDAIAGENYLRGVQVAGADGTVRFTSIFPGAYAGRWPHVHFEVYADRSAATSSGSPVRTSQLALPQSAAAAVYATAGYPGSAANLARLSLARDNVFGDGYDRQLATVTGAVTAGYTATLAVPV
ncbi:protocatechuate 3,4-dioxygenase beta subunit [Frankia sp. QA3]|uniref:dioxygenase family protein n=1 Tax=Frankia sp. QA3 TaxID=710111 RepID=UPI000269BCBA|nr:protocatechuate 3,4-dioxygenase beta subunit [Frankia sp. QA3]EIV92231.1 protocatechuate 3,4-dioxygenase beta subunit [Frankia sp. QA3]